MPQTVPPALTARIAHNGLDHNVRFSSASYYSAMTFGSTVSTA